MTARMWRRAVSKRVEVGALAPIVLVALLAGCAGSPSMLRTHGREAHRIAMLWWVMFWIGVAVYVIVIGLVIAAMVRRRHAAHGPVTSDGVDGGDGVEPVDVRRRERGFIVIGGVAVPALILAFLAVETVRTTNALRPPRGDVHVDVVSEQYWWRVTYPDLGVVTANEIHVPVGRAVELALTSPDVVHSFWVPQLNGKTDVVPGQTNHLSFTATAPGAYRGQCAEYCGLSHARMAFVVIAESPADFDAWAVRNAAPAAVPSAGDALVQRGAQLVATTSCAGCHRVGGTAAAGTKGPDLTHVASRRTLAAGALENTTAAMSDWLSRTQAIKPGARMPTLGLSDADITAIVAYLRSLT